MSRTVRAPNPRGPSMAESLKRLESRIADVETRLAKVEVVKAGPQELDVDLYRGEPAPEEPQKPETE